MVPTSLRRIPGFEEAVLVAVTGFGRDEDRQQAADAGFTHHVTKPLDPKLLPALVEPSSDDGAGEE